MSDDLRKKTKKGVYWTFIQQFLGNGLSFFVGITLARILSPEDYGITAIPVVFTSIANVFIESGFSTAMIRKPELSDKDLATAFYYSEAVGIFCFILLFVTAPFIAVIYDTPVLTALVRVTAMSFLWTPLTTPQSILLKRSLNFKTPAKVFITSNVIGALIGIFLAIQGFGLWSLVIMNLANSFFTFLLTWLAVKWLPKTGWSKESFRYLWGFGNKLVFSAFIDRVYSNLTTLIVGKFYSKSDLGVYSRAKGYADLPSVQGTNIIQLVTFPVLSKMQNDAEALSRNYRKMLKVTAFVIFPVMTILAALARPFILVLLTDKWMDSVVYLQLICFASLWYPINAINLNLLQVKGRSDLFLRLEIWKKCISITVMMCTLPFGLIYFVAAGIVSSLITVFINTYYTGKLINVGYLKQMKDLLPILCLSILSFIIIILLNQVISNLWAQLIVGGIAGFSVYFGVAFLFKFPELQEVKYMLNRKL